MKNMLLFLIVAVILLGLICESPFIVILGVVLTFLYWFACLIFSYSKYVVDNKERKLLIKKFAELLVLSGRDVSLVLNMRYSEFDIQKVKISIAFIQDEMTFKNMQDERF